MSTNKFKAGDKVRCVRDYLHNITLNQVYKINRVINGVCMIRTDTGDIGGYAESVFELVEQYLTPEEVFEHLRKGTKLQVNSKRITPRDVSYNWVDIGEDFMVDLTYDTICTKTFRIKPEPEIITLNGKRYQAIED